MAEKFKLHLNDGQGKTRTFDFDRRKVVIGRDPSADVVIDDIQISRKHLIITRGKTGFFAEDNGSTNGTFFNGKRITKKMEFKPGAELVLGQDQVLTLEAIEPQTQPQEQSSETVRPPEEQPDVLAPDIDLADTEAETSDSDSTGVMEEPEAEAEPEPKPAEPQPVSEAPLQKSKKQRPKWLIILLAALAFIVIFCVIPLIVIEVTNQWCDLFAGFFNSMSPGVCP